MQETACSWRLSIVLHELRYPAQKWMILTTADTYGADVQTRIELQDLPEATYHDIGGVVAAVESTVGRRTATPQLPETRCCDWRA
jgi:Protein of unknown function (DUF2795)